MLGMDVPTTLGSNQNIGPLIEKIDKVQGSLDLIINSLGLQNNLNIEKKTNVNRDSKCIDKLKVIIDDLEQKINQLGHKIDHNTNLINSRFEQQEETQSLNLQLHSDNDSNSSLIFVPSHTSDPWSDSEVEELEENEFVNISTQNQSPSPTTTTIVTVADIACVQEIMPLPKLHDCWSFFKWKSNVDLLINTLQIDNLKDIPLKNLSNAMDRIKLTSLINMIVNSIHHNNGRFQQFFIPNILNTTINNLLKTIENMYSPTIININSELTRLKHTFYINSEQFERKSIWANNLFNIAEESNINITNFEKLGILNIWIKKRSDLIDIFNKEIGHKDYDEIVLLMIKEIRISEDRRKNDQQ